MYGVDYGAKLAGTTVVAFLSENGARVEFTATAKKQDADAFLLAFFAEKAPAKIFLDAPLSLPAVYAQQPMPADGNYFYRECDKALGAMSPMFLGGLTARAMSLAGKLRAMGHVVVETYPGALARLLGLKEKGYKTKRSEIPICLQALVETAGLEVDGRLVQSWHHFDALLALCSYLRSQENRSETFGILPEGLITV